MQDWSMIPLHIRCTDRNKIDETYPKSDAKWWKITEEVANRMGRGRLKEAYNGIPMTVLKYARSIRGDRYALEALAGACKVDVKDLDAGIRVLKRGHVEKEKDLKGLTEGEIVRDPWLMKEGV